LRIIAIMKQRRGLLSLLGFLMVVIGFLALVYSLVGLKLSFLVWLDLPGPLFGFVMKLLIVILGFVFVYIDQTDFKGEA
jgi:hypothetical protein